MRSNLSAVLEKVKSSHDNLSRDTYTGWMRDKIHVGEQVVMDTREEGMLVTTAVKTVRFISENVVEFDTRNSTYRLTYVKEDHTGEEFYITQLERDLLQVFVQQKISSNLAIIGYLKELTKKLCGINPNA